MKSALWSIGGAVALMALASGSALAGGPAYCGPGAGQNCDAGVAVLPSPVGHSGPTTVENRTPYDYFDSVHFQRAPHVSITRVHGLGPNVGLTDAPVGFTKGCHPHSTTYCRSGHTNSGLVGAAMYPPRPLMGHSGGSVTSTANRVVATGSGYDPSKFIPRIYGDPYTITPGIAYLPTSIVDRNPSRAQAVLDSGQARPNPLTAGGVTPALSGLPIGPHIRPGTWTGGPMARPPMPYPARPYYGAPGAPVRMSGGRYGSPVGANGTYWEKVSGPTQFGNTLATQVICKRKLPHYRPTPKPMPYPTPPAPCVSHGPSRY